MRETRATVDLGSVYADRPSEVVGVNNTRSPGGESSTAAVAAAAAGESRRVDGGHGPFTFDEFEAFYGAEEARRRWEAAEAGEAPAGGSRDEHVRASSSAGNRSR